MKQQVCSFPLLFCTCNPFPKRFDPISIAKGIPILARNEPYNPPCCDFVGLRTTNVL